MVAVAFSERAASGQNAAPPSALPNRRRVTSVIWICSPRSSNRSNITSGRWSVRGLWSNRAAAVDFQHDAGDEGRLVGGEVKTRAGDILGLRQPAERYGGNEFRAIFRRVGQS